MGLVSLSPVCSIIVMLDPSYQISQQEGQRYQIILRQKVNGVETLIWIIAFRIKDGIFHISIEEDMLKAEGNDFYEAFEHLQVELSNSGQLLCCCGNCQNMQMTGMCRQMSDGFTGYCLIDLRHNGHFTRDQVSIFDHCDWFEFGPQEFIRSIESIEVYIQKLNRKGQGISANSEEE